MAVTGWATSAPLAVKGSGKGCWSWPSPKAICRLWRRAVAAGSIDGKVADRFSIWLVKEHEYEAAQVLRQALSAAQNSAELAERMRRRLARCQRSIPVHTTTMGAATTYLGGHKGQPQED
jgi:hypothetical protein